MAFLHDGRPTVVRQATWQSSNAASDAATRLHGNADRLHGRPAEKFSPPTTCAARNGSFASTITKSRGQRHQAAGRHQRRRPRDAAVVMPILGSIAAAWRSAAASIRTMAISIPTGWRPRHRRGGPQCRRRRRGSAAIAMLDNFCWGNTDRPEVLGSLVRRRGVPRCSPGLGTPFISGKDSLNNEYRTDGQNSPFRRRCSSAPLGRCPTSAVA